MISISSVRGYPAPALCWLLSGGQCTRSQQSLNLRLWGWVNSAEVSDGNINVLSIPSFRWIRVNEDSSLRSQHQCALIGRNTMLVMGGIHSKGQNLQPFDATGCDTSEIISQGLGFFLLNNHTWSFSYNTSEGPTAYEVDPTIT